MELFNNPFRPSAGQYPPYLAGREKEIKEFSKLISQKPILKNLVLTGLRGVGKTVLLETFKPMTYEAKWFWVGTDLNEAASLSEHNLSIRLLADLSKLVVSISKDKTLRAVFSELFEMYNSTPGLEADKLKYVLEQVWETSKAHIKGIVIAYDEAQMLKDNAADKEYPLSLLLEVISYIQKLEIPYLLVLTGLPTLYPNLTEARTYAERMFQVITLDKLTEPEVREAIEKPIESVDGGCPVRFNENGIKLIIKYSSGYPYFIQFICKEVFDDILQQIKVGIDEPNVFEFTGIIRKLDIDFYSARWSRITDRQKDLLDIIAKLPSANEEFTIKEVVSLSKDTANPFTTAHVNNTFTKLIDAGLIFKNRRSKYSFAVPLLADFITRQRESQLN